MIFVDTRPDSVIASSSLCKSLKPDAVSYTLIPLDRGEIMTLTLEIAPEIEHALEDGARRAGVPVTDYAVRVLAESVVGNGTANGASGQTVTELPKKTPSEILTEISALSVDYGRVETASVDHDKILYGEGYGR